jgi:hypothetical protein
MRTASVAAASEILVAALITGPACGGSAFSAADAGAVQDAASDTAVRDSGPLETGTPDTAPPACILPPNGVGTEGAFCSLLATKSSTCGECEACRQLDENDCVALGDTLSVAFKDALAACAPRLGCGDLSMLTNNQCVREQLGAVPQNAAQQAVKSAYCAACPANMAECVSFFDFTPDAGASAGLGIWAMTLNEALDQQIAATCSGATAPHCDAFTYSVCGGLVFCGKAPHSHCMHGLCNP